MPHPPSDRTPADEVAPGAARPPVRRADQLGAPARNPEDVDSPDRDLALAAQMAARERASAEDARAQAERRAAAAARALGNLQVPAPVVERPAEATLDLRQPVTAPAPPDPAPASLPSPPLPPPPLPAPPAGPATTSEDTDPPASRPPVPSGGPAAAISRAFGAVLAQRPPEAGPAPAPTSTPGDADPGHRARTTPGPRPGPVDEPALLAKLVELYRAGVLDDQELAAKADVVARLARADRAEPDEPRTDG